MTKRRWLAGTMLALLTVLGGWAGCGSEDSPVIPPVEVVKPGTPQAVSPANGEMNISYTGVELKWRTVTSKNGAVTYSVYYGPSGGVMAVAEGLTDTTLQVGGELLFDTEYSWRVVAKDVDNKSNQATFRFLVQTCHGIQGRLCDFAGTGLPGGGAPGQAPKKTALYLPQDVCFDSAGDPYVLDWNNHRVLVLDSNNHFKVLVGGSFGDAPDGIADQIGLNHPTHVSFDPSGNLILTAWHNSILKRMNKGSNTITTFCGDGSRSFKGDGGPADLATLDLPVVTVFDSNGNMVIGDQANMRVRRIDAVTGVIETIAGSGPVRLGDFSGDGGPATQARLSFEAGQAANPSGKICLDPDDNIYIADTSNHCVRIVTIADGIINTFAGVGLVGAFDGDGGQATSAHLRTPRDVDFFGGALYIADTGNHCVRKVDASGVITTIAGVPTMPGHPDRDGMVATQANLLSPYGVVVDPAGNVWITDTENHMIRILYQ